MTEEKDNIPLKSFSNSTWLLDEEKKKDRQKPRARAICHKRKIVVLSFNFNFIIQSYDFLYCAGTIFSGSEYL
jgi:hypothetical protein